MSHSEMSKCTYVNMCLCLCKGMYRLSVQRAKDSCAQLSSVPAKEWCEILHDVFAVLHSFL